MRYKKLKVEKRKNLDKFKRIKRSLVKVKIEKKRINKEIKQLHTEWMAQVNADPVKAKAMFSDMVKAVGNDDIFPKDLEAEFDKIDREHVMGKNRSMKIADLSDSADLKVPKSIADALEKELEADLGEDTKTVDSEDLDEETKSLLDDNRQVGFSDGDIQIDENGNEVEE